MRSFFFFFLTFFSSFNHLLCSHFSIQSNHTFKQMTCSFLFSISWDTCCYLHLLSKIFCLSHPSLHLVIRLFISIFIFFGSIFLTIDFLLQMIVTVLYTDSSLENVISLLLYCLLVQHSSTISFSSPTIFSIFFTSPQISLSPLFTMLILYSDSLISS